MFKKIVKYAIIAPLALIMTGCGIFGGGNNQPYVDVIVTPPPTPTPEPTPEPTPTPDVDPTKKLIALTFDDGPRVESTALILDTLEKYHAKATFFVVGNCITNDERKANMKRAVELGCEIGNHSYSHPDAGKWKGLTYEEYCEQIDKTNEAVEAVTGIKPKVFRCPGGNLTDPLKKALRERNMPNMYWYIDTLDWRNRDVEMNVASVLESDRLKDGAIILMHDIHMPTAQACERIVKGLQEKGYQLVTISELFSAKGVELKGATTYYSSFSSKD